MERETECKCGFSDIETFPREYDIDGEKFWADDYRCPKCGREWSSDDSPVKLDVSPHG